MTRIIERAAQAIASKRGVPVVERTDGMMAVFRMDAQTAIASMLEPTTEMTIAGLIASNELTSESLAADPASWFRPVWRAMIKVALGEVYITDVVDGEFRKTVLAPAIHDSADNMDAIHDKRDEIWQPIETAPKDVCIILGRPGARVQMGKWYEDNEPGFYSYDHGYDLFGFGDQPTHWMPLPASPVPAMSAAPILCKDSKQRYTAGQ